MMAMFRSLRDSALLRKPLLSFVRLCLKPLTTRSRLLRRAAYDVEAMPLLVVGDREKYIVSTKDKVIGRELFLHGEFDFRKLEAALEILRREQLPSPTHLIDVGANIGTIVVPAIARGLMSSATAIEPHPDNIRLLRANLALNNVADKVQILAQAVGSDSAEVLFLAESATNSGNHTIGENGISIPSTRLDDIELPHARALLWMDIEGYEGHALHGAKALLASRVPVVCEFNPTFLRRSGGDAWFRDALRHHEIYDLKHGSSANKACLRDLLTEYGEHSSYTDILAIPTRTP